VTASGGASVGSADLSRLLGSTRTAVAEAAPEPAADARFKLIGVVAPKSKQSRHDRWCSAAWSTARWCCWR
jgi:hypothetical protein